MQPYSRWTRALGALFLVAAASFAPGGLAETAPAKTYGLKVGDSAPAIAVNDIDGKAFALAEQLKQGPVVVIFYRGGWCPFCNVQLHNVETKLVPKIAAQQATIVAISVDRPTEGQATKQKHALMFRIISDPKAALLGTYQVQYHVPDELAAKYKTKYGIDLEAASGEKHHIIAVPAVYVVNQKGLITYAHVDEDYKKRADETEVAAAVAKAAQP